MKEAIKSMFTDKDGSVSMKRFVMILLTFLFILIVIVNLFWGKIVEASLVSSLVAIMWYIYGLVFAENITDTIKKAKGVDATTPDPK
jgi:hypothetical protein